jgi:hypothetical protein
LLDGTVWEESEVEIVLGAASEVLSVEVKDVVLLDAVVVKSNSEVIDDSDVVETEYEVSGE